MNIEDMPETVTITGSFVTAKQVVGIRAEIAADEQAERDERELSATDRQPVYQLRHSAVSGCHPWTAENGPKFETREAARAALRECAAALVARGFTIDPMPDALADSFEVEEPEGCAMVPDEVGHGTIVDDVKECDRANERRRELYY